MLLYDAYSRFQNLLDEVIAGRTRLTSSGIFDINVINFTGGERNAKKTDSHSGRAGIVVRVD